MSLSMSSKWYLVPSMPQTPLLLLENWRVFCLLLISEFLENWKVIQTQTTLSGSHSPRQFNWYLNGNHKLNQLWHLGCNSSRLLRSQHNNVGLRMDLSLLSRYWFWIPWDGARDWYEDLNEDIHHSGPIAISAMCTPWRWIGIRYVSATSQIN